MYCRNYTGTVSHVLCREVYYTVHVLISICTNCSSTTCILNYLCKCSCTIIVCLQSRTALVILNLFLFVTNSISASWMYYVKLSIGHNSMQLPKY